MPWKKDKLAVAEYEERKEYFELLLTGDHPKKGHKKIKEALKCAHDIRKFEIELFWKRATYFWVFISVIILAYGSLVITFLEPPTVREKPPEEVFSRELILFLAILLLNSLGLVISYIWYLVMKGSKFWQENWEAHINMLESSVTGHLHKVLFKDGTETIFSVSKLSQAVAICCILTWGVLLLSSIVLYWYKQPYVAIIYIAFFILIGIGAYFCIRYTCKSKGASQGFYQCD